MTGVLVPVSGSVGTAGCRFFCWDGEGRQREVASVRGVDAVGGVFEVLWVDVVEGRQRKEASLRAGTPSGDTTRAP